MNKNILIFGAGRAGKTTLANKICQDLNYFPTSTDDLVTMFLRAYPHMGINYEDYMGSAAILAPFLGHYIGVRSRYENRLVVEGYFDFEKIIPVLEKYDMGNLKEHFLLIGLIYPNQTIDGLVSDIRKCDTEDDWTHSVSDDELREHAAISIEYSRNFYEEYKKYDPVIYDVSHDREQVLNRVANDIKNVVYKG